MGARSRMVPLPDQLAKPQENQEKKTNQNNSPSCTPLQEQREKADKGQIP